MRTTLQLLRNRPIWVTLACLVLVLAFGIWSFAEGNRKLSHAEVPDGAQRMNAIVKLKFRPETFHIQIMQSIGQVVRVDGDRILLRDADVASLRSAARNHWVRDVLPWTGQL